MRGGVQFATTLTDAGFAELDRRNNDEIELVQFGLMPKFLGQGLGKYFLQWTIDKAWSYQPKRFWLRTCTLDHPAPNYLKSGFVLLRKLSFNGKFRGNLKHGKGVGIVKSHICRSRQKRRFPAP
jgi:GNAT superfamily N-acetyltransferase